MHSLSKIFQGLFCCLFLDPFLCENCDEALLIQIFLATHKSPRLACYGKFLIDTSRFYSITSNVHIILLTKLTKEDLVSIEEDLYRSVYA